MRAERLPNGPQARGVLRPEGGQSPGGPGRARWHLLGRVLTWAFFLLVLALLARQARSIDWNAVGASLSRLPAARAANFQYCVPGGSGVG